MAVLMAQFKQCRAANHCDLDLHASCQLYLDCHAYQIAIVVSLLSCLFLWGDMFGYRRIYKCGFEVVFLLSSLFCALSDSLQMLTLARTRRGFYVAALMSANTALIRLIWPPASFGTRHGIQLYRRSPSAAGPTIAAGDSVHLIMEMAVSGLMSR